MRKMLAGWSDHPSTIRRTIHRASLPFWLAGKFIFNARYRSERLSSLLYPGQCQQPVTWTAPDRYPELFYMVAKTFGNEASPRLLSYGCSTGEEVETLKHYLPHAEITGTDINHWCIRQCKKKQIPQACFLHRFDKSFLSAKNYDAIFCMAVFQHHENRSKSENEITSKYTFDQFENEILFLDKKLNIGGLFIIDNTDFSFADTKCYRNYIPLNAKNNLVIQERPLYNRNNQKIGDTQEISRVFVKQK